MLRDDCFDLVSLLSTAVSQPFVYDSVTMLGLNNFSLCESIPTDNKRIFLVSVKKIYKKTYA